MTHFDKYKKYKNMYKMMKSWSFSKGTIDQQVFSRIQGQDTKNMMEFLSPGDLINLRHLITKQEHHQQM
jgi:hypothetical protein